MPSTADIPAEHRLTDEERRQFRGALLDWYTRNRRELPWRGVDDPYAVWVSEIMLQQTQVATVIDYYHRWLERFPTVEDLAGAEREEVMELWAGLGYYRRARFLHESARIVADEMGGELPETAKELKALKGIGPYTAGAIASIAFGEAVPVVDGNVERVLSRVRAISGDPKSTPNQKLYWKLAGELVDPRAPGDFNQAMMELGATICTPQSPTCMLCPVREHCVAFAEGDPTEYPATAKRSRQRPVSVQTCIVVTGEGEQERFLVIKRPPDGLLGGLWEFPTVVEEEGEEPTVESYLVDCLATQNLETSERDELGELVHHFSHIRMTIRAESRRVHADELPAAADAFDQPVQWVDRAELERLPMSAAMRKVLALFE